MDEVLFNVIPGFEDEFTSSSFAEPEVHLRIQKRNAKKAITIIEGLDKDTCKLALKVLRKKLNVNGALKVDSDDNIVLQLQGDQRSSVREYLLTNKITSSDYIHMHGY